MANPQAENGHCDIANDIVEALAKIRIPGEAYQVLWFIFRKTYGWHKRYDSISLSQFEKGTGLKRSHVCRSIKKLVDLNIIYRGSPNNDTPPSPNNGTTPIQVYGFQKDFELWGVVPIKGLSPNKGTGGSPKFGNRVVPILGHTKETIQKKLYKRKGVVQLVDEDFWKETRKIYYWLDIDQMIAKMKGYQLTPKGRDWKFSKRSVITWLNRQDKPLEVKTNGPESDAPPTDPMDRKLWELRRIREKEQEHPITPEKLH